MNHEIRFHLFLPFLRRLVVYLRCIESVSILSLVVSIEWYNFRLYARCRGPKWGNVSEIGVGFTYDGWSFRFCDMTMCFGNKTSQFETPCTCIQKSFCEYISIAPFVAITVCCFLENMFKTVGRSRCGFEVLRTNRCADWSMTIFLVTHTGDLFHLRSAYVSVTYLFSWRNSRLFCQMMALVF